MSVLLPSKAAWSVDVSLAMPYLRFAQNRALSRKVSDGFTVPLCRGHHREVHRQGDEAAWWHKLDVDPADAARALWLETRPNGAKYLAAVSSSGPRRLLILPLSLRP
jgi:hypothetical protein